MQFRKRRDGRVYRFRGSKPILVSKYAVVGKNNGRWKGTNVSRDGLHDYVISHKPKPDNCEDCGIKTSELDLSNESQKYKRSLDDWKWRCRRCHVRQDGRIQNLKQFQNLQK